MTTHHMEYAAHVDHPISHSSSAAQIGLGIALALTAIGTGGGTLAVIGAIGGRMFIGLEIGSFVDNFLPRGNTGRILSGFSSVRLGPDVKHAARAHEDSRVGCHGGHWVEQGSEVVLLGPETRPMARRQDKTTCAGVISEGVQSRPGAIIVGGTPSAVPKRSEAPHPVVWWMSLLSGVAGAATPLGKGNLIEAGGALVGTVAEAAGESQVGALTRLGTGSARFPAGGSMWDRAEWAAGVRSAGWNALGL